MEVRAFYFTSHPAPPLAVEWSVEPRLDTAYYSAKLSIRRVFAWAAGYHGVIA